ncbi:unnamed protein product [Cyprideis torosa]|uniref:Uncharacterized protein n=1 Tax=Cyprideis torosa TaxID=163714 RepID=A0A7R8WL58_9CRUS|nr:unnamed protein product [Cyprideis torosa]CAG0897652.1 unnamed protein product [Cyprideis torosa]
MAIDQRIHDIQKSDADVLEPVHSLLSRIVISELSMDMTLTAWIGRASPKRILAQKRAKLNILSVTSTQIVKALPYGMIGQAAGPTQEVEREEDSKIRSGNDPIGDHTIGDGNAPIGDHTIGDGNDPIGDHTIGDGNDPIGDEDVGKRSPTASERERELRWPKAASRALHDTNSSVLRYGMMPERQPKPAEEKREIVTSGKPIPDLEINIRHGNFLLELFRMKATFEREIRHLSRESSLSIPMAEKSASTVAVVGNTVESVPQKSFRLLEAVLTVREPSRKHLNDASSFGSIGGISLFLMSALFARRSQTP